MFPIEVIHEAAQRAGAPYLLIGGHAVNTYGEPRSTLDVDFLVRKEDERRWRELLLGEGFKLQHQAGNFIQFAPPYGTVWRVDLMFVNGDTFAKLMDRSRLVQCFGFELRVPSALHLIALKLHAVVHGPEDRREKDFSDIINLARNTSLDPEASEVLDVFARYGTPELYKRFHERLVP